MTNAKTSAQTVTEVNLWTDTLSFQLSTEKSVTEAVVTANAALSAFRAAFPNAESGE